MANVPYPKAIFTTIIGWRVSVLINDICYKLLKKICKGSAIDNFVIRVIQLWSDNSTAALSINFISLLIWYRKNG